MKVAEDQAELGDLWSLLYLPRVYDYGKLNFHTVSRQETGGKESCVFQSNHYET